MSEDLLSEITKRTVEAEAEADEARLKTAEQSQLTEPPPKSAAPKRDWRGKSAAELMGNRGRIRASTDVHTGGAKELP